MSLKYEPATETVNSDGARHMGSTVQVGVWLEGPRERERERERETPVYEPLREAHTVVAGEGGVRAVCPSWGVSGVPVCTSAW